MRTRWEKERKLGKKMKEDIEKIRFESNGKKRIKRTRKG